MMRPAKAAKEVKVPPAMLGSCLLQKQSHSRNQSGPVTRSLLRPLRETSVFTSNHVNNFFPRARCKFATRSYVAGMDTRERISELVENPEQVQELAAAVQEQGKELLHTADDWIRRNPYLAMGIALAVGCAIAGCLRNHHRE
jgi:ElaB/YqjD/DUF883 family membrane-anchored ribosome-binding protein